DRVKREIQKERFLPVPVDEGDRFAGECVGQVLGLLNRFVATVDGRGRPRRRRRLYSREDDVLHARLVNMGPPEETKILVESAILGMKLRPSSQVPFAHARCGIAG